MEVYHTFDHEGNYLNSGYFPALKFEFVGQTFRELLLCERDGIAAAQGFQRSYQQPEIRSPYQEVEVRTSLYQPISFHLDYRFGSRINYDSPDGVAPFLAGRSSIAATLTIRPSQIAPGG